MPKFDKTKNKSMEKVCIKPVDESIKTRVDALNLLNEFKILGFSRSSFIGVVQDNIEKYKDYRNVKKIISFWDGRNHRENINEEMAQLIEKLKAE